jgi:hypothetical protein
MTITLTREEAQQVLDAFELLQTDIEWQFKSPNRAMLRKIEKTFCTRLAQPEPEPVAWTTDIEFDYDTEIITAKDKGKLGTSMNDIPLYTAPPQREWRDLTKGEFIDATDGLEDLEDCWIQIQAKLKEKNYDKP